MLTLVNTVEAGSVNELNPGYFELDNVMFGVTVYDGKIKKEEAEIPLAMRANLGARRFC